MVVITIKGAKTIIKCSENLCLQCFDEPQLIVFNECFIHLLELCLFTHEIGIPQILNNFIVLKEFFYVQKTYMHLQDNVLSHLEICICFLLFENIHFD
jgi:hypothetical protein